MAESFSLKRFGSSSDDDKKQLLVEIVRAHTVSVRNEGYPTQIRRTIRDLADALNPQFEQANGISLSALADALWNVCALIDKRVNNDLAQRQNVLSRKSTAEIVNAFLKLYCPDNDKSATQFRAKVARARLTLHDLRGYITQQWDRGNFRLFYISMDEMVSCYPGPVGRRKLEEIVLLWSLELGSLAVAEPEHLHIEPLQIAPLINAARQPFIALCHVLTVTFLTADRGLCKPAQGNLRAGDEARTRDVHLGKVVLYQLSYTRSLRGTIMSSQPRHATFLIAW